MNETEREHLECLSRHVWSVLAVVAVVGGGQSSNKEVRGEELSCSGAPAAQVSQCVPVCPSVSHSWWGRIGPGAPSYISQYCCAVSVV